MPKHRLNISFSGTDLPIIYKAAQKVVIVKRTKDIGDSQVVWVAFDPFEYNTVEWETNYAIYASNTEIQGGATINKLADINAQTQINYSFKDGIFQNSVVDSQISKNTYELTNCMRDSHILTFGLAQNVVLNNEDFANHPINAIYVPFQQSATLTPIENVDVYLQSGIITSTVVSTITSAPINITFTGETEISIKYDIVPGKFVPMS